ncbi:MAG: Asp-tRNA(Asn)/Glu-tRNA(Gln) amidotransferase subunit GatB [Syntrophales bacterium]|jgi:aspartyl-tRNA(Asn)/glutamyl-tRNA(Gln) amidotransferase subunit B|nr:Asp-tRNA(Asn)/Glu-tRNA(Gln) amidotransferase subunit GatB [Syntrophales bacterium]MDY0045371.1 Asp-tRNA(Asn)/Glu-tRNA(Gln) amidotransferase subunit GatB [Syntrophales bacterium]
MKYEAVIGLEIHVQLNSKTKMFCDCPNCPGDDPNKNTCPICLWLPGAIPRFSEEVLEKATITALALNCEIQPVNAFDQKVYYYPDLPKGFQLSQFHKPLAKNGWVEIFDEEGCPKKIGIHQVHMEEDVAKLMHETEGRTPISLVDFNRAGTPLTEIVSKPDIRTPFEAMEYIKALRAQIRYAGSAECSMEQGTMRVDANVSIRPEGSEELNTKVEIKNMNSIHNVGDAIAYEIERQAKCLDTGEPIILHTRLWDPEKKVTLPMRGKFEGPCIPDPSVPPITISEEWLNKMRTRLPEMPVRKAARFTDQYGLNHDEASLMSSERELSEYFETVTKLAIPPRTAVHWISTQLMPLMKDNNQTFPNLTITPERLASLIGMLERDEINAKSAREVLTKLFSTDSTPEAIVNEFGFRQVSDTDALVSLIDSVLAKNPQAVSDLKAGTQKAMGFLIGQAMQASKGKANPKLIREILLKKFE